MHFSHELIYTAIYECPRKELPRQLIACLRRGRNIRMPRKRGVARRLHILGMISVHERRTEIEDRLMRSHREGNCIKGAGDKFSVGVVVERTSPLVLLARMDDATAASALAGFTAKLNSIAASMHHTLAFDQGKEITRPC
jgi:IS30 family transposase